MWIKINFSTFWEHFFNFFFPIFSLFFILLQKYYTNFYWLANEFNFNKQFLIHSKEKLIIIPRQINAKYYPYVCKYELKILFQTNPSFHKNQNDKSRRNTNKLKLLLFKTDDSPSVNIFSISMVLFYQQHALHIITF